MYTQRSSSENPASSQVKMYRFPHNCLRLATAQTRKTKASIFKIFFRQIIYHQTTAGAHPSLQIYAALNKHLLSHHVSPATLQRPTTSVSNLNTYFLHQKPKLHVPTLRNNCSLSCLNTRRNTEIRNVIAQVLAVYSLKRSHSLTTFAKDVERIYIPIEPQTILEKPLPVSTEVTAQALCRLRQGFFWSRLA